jgi:hypothetical protein
MIKHSVFNCGWNTKFEITMKESFFCSKIRGEKAILSRFTPKSSKIALNLFLTFSTDKFKMIEAFKCSHRAEKLLIKKFKKLFNSTFFTYKESHLMSSLVKVINH